MSTLPAQHTIQEPDYEQIKRKQQSSWGSGDYSRVGVTVQITGESLCEAMDLRSGNTVLDIAAGNGNVTLAAARRFCKVVSTDYVDSLLNHSRSRCEAEGLSVDYQHADAENLPFGDNSFDNVVSTFGVMFTPNQARSASEMIRVCRPGGKIGMANWTPDSFIGQVFKTLGSYIPPPAGINSPARWATNEFLQQQFGSVAERITSPVKQFTFRYQSPRHWLDVFSNYYGPLLKAFEALDADKASSLRKDIRSLIDSLNAAKDGTMVVPSDYAETIIMLR